ncbi:hypothetical protein ACHAXR_001806 [Thalassiosira sp. AJA248-18]
MEGMISKEALPIQSEFIVMGGVHVIAGRVGALLETTCGQWLHYNMHVHDPVSGVHAVRRKEQLQKEIEDQLEFAREGLAE